MDKILASPFIQFFWKSWVIEPNSSTYNIVMEQNIKGSLDEEKLKWALQEFLDLYPFFKYRIEEKDNELYWISDSDKPYVVEFTHLSNNEEQLKQFALQPFDLIKGPLIRFGLIKEAEQQFQLFIVLHHITGDAQGIEEFFHNISDLYNQRPLRHAPMTLQQASEKFEQDRQLLKLLSKYNPEEYWKKCLSDVTTSNPLPYLSQQAIGEPELPNEFRFNVPLEDWNNLTQSLAPCKSFLVFKTLWATLVAQYIPSGRVHLIYPIAAPEGASLSLGAQINAVVFPLRLHDTDSFNSLYQATLNYSASLKAQPDLRFSNLPIFQAVPLNLVNQLNVGINQASFKDISLELDGCEVNYGNRFNNDLAVTEWILEYHLEKNHWAFRIRYHPNLFHAKQIRALGEQFQQLLVNALTNPETPISQLPLLTPEQTQTLLEYGNLKQLGDTEAKRHNSLTIDLIRTHYQQATGLSQSAEAEISGVQAYVLNERLQLVPMGLSGELYLSGPELDNNYLEKPALAAKQLIANPFVQHTNDKWLYRTGEQVRWLPNGELEYLNATHCDSLKEAS
ncbi:amino acid adenylation domain protein [Xenorhabdus vietnamensis]|uniref:Amino acid adenylation domain protein n=1 Tax=Xenorhabdus vietnamensis TaxID=351656 RepID=A0A1Y2SIT5_9GAMM|nr:condensation domain-containing protein [Xenorhabdus vietnamensis]OTA18527.1 amino acid adenylation domain protein [Xenorhabdus vietnamensis]